MEPKLEHQTLRFILEHKSDFLTTSEIANVLFSCKELAQLRHSFNFLHTLAQKCESVSETYNPNLRRFFKKLITASHSQSYTESQRKAIEIWETKYVLSRNAIINSSGKHDLKGWNIIENGGSAWKVEDFWGRPPHKSCFVASYSLCKMRYTVPIERFLKSDLTVKSLLEKAVFKAGCSIARRNDCCARGEISFTVLDAEGKTLYFKNVEVSNSEFRFNNGGGPIQKIVEFVYDPSQENKDSMPKYFSLTISGQDEQFWAGWYGPRFSDASIRSYVRNVDDSIGSLKITDKRDREGLLKSDEENKHSYPSAEESSKYAYSLSENGSVEEESEDEGGLFGD